MYIPTNPEVLFFKNCYQCIKLHQLPFQPRFLLFYQFIKYNLILSIYQFPHHLHIKLFHKLLILEYCLLFFLFLNKIYYLSKLFFSCSKSLF